MPIEYPFATPTEDHGFCLFPSELEDDELTVFHGTALCNFDSILQNGFRPKPPLASVSFARRSSGALRWASNARGTNSPHGLVLAARLATLSGVVVENSDVHVIRLCLMPTIVGFCVVPACYSYV